MSKPAQKIRSYLWPLLIFFVLALGIILGFEFHEEVNGKQPITTVINRNDRLEELINIINKKYVDSVHRDSLYQNAVAGILSHLDPHTTYIPAAMADQTNAELKGEYRGLGISLLIYKDTFRITHVEKNSPAEKAGLKIGEALIALNRDTLIPAQHHLNLLSNYIQNNDEDSIKLVLKIPGRKETKRIKVPLAEVKISGVPVAYMLTHKTGYIKIAKFTNDTGQEFIKALKTLKGKGLEKLILDLRNNPGGFVEAATQVADQFLKKGNLIVYTKGRKEPRQNYNADGNGLFQNGRLVILINAGTASAAEILTGAVQDWDRGMVIGQRSFGKGLVQQQYELGDGALLRLTVARYYTPSGRCIQRPYNKGKAAYYSSFRFRLLHPDSVANVFKDTTITRQPFYSLNSHRTLYGGGGIQPDVKIPFQKPFSDENMTKVTQSKAMEEICIGYFIHHYSQWRQYKTPKGLLDHAQIPDSTLKHLKIKSRQQYPKAVYHLWQNPLALDYIREQIKLNLIKYHFGQEKYQRIINQSDDDVQQAKQLLKGKKYSQIIGGKVV